MSFVRPEVHALVWRWREVMAAGAALVLGAYWTLGSSGLLRWLGAVVLVLGGMALVAGIQRARFRVGRDGPGVVHFDEGEVVYYGPLNGGSVALAELTQLDLDRSASPPVWTLRQPGRAPIYIPLTAEGADVLFDAFARLPGLRTEAMLREMQSGERNTVSIWRKEVLRLH